MAFDIVQIQRNDESVRRYADQYKAFRLLALKTSPESFGSTYAREVAFTDDVWYQRLANPRATTFIVVEEGEVLSSLTVTGPLPYSIEESPISGDPWIRPPGSNAEGISHYRFNGIFTLPSARRRGIAQALLTPAIEFAREEAEKVRTTFLGSIAVDADNPAARSLYEKSGFVPIREEALGDRKVVLLEYSPTSGKGQQA